MTAHTLLIFRYLFFIICLCVSSQGTASFNKILWPQWEMTNSLSTKTISHQHWQDFLNRNLHTNAEGINLIDYEHISADDKLLLRNYVQELSRLPIEQYNRNEQLAYWLNLYNAVTVQTVMNYYPVSSIQDISISPGLFSMGPWGASLIKVNNTDLSLEDIHNRIIRPIWNDPRTHYAINNGTIGAANLSKHVFTGQHINEQLNQVALQYINSFRGVQVIEGKLIVSKIYEWFTEDFGGSKTDVIIHIQNFAQEPLRSQLKHVNAIDNFIYNWHLNHIPVDVAEKV